jgi:hypothetical protein
LVLLLRLQGHVVHKPPLLLLKTVYDGSTVPLDEGYVLGTDLNCSESLGCHRQ